MKPTESIYEHIKNPKSPIYVMSRPWKVAQNVMTSIISANRAGKLNIFNNQKYSKKIQNKMNFQLLKHKEFKQEKIKNSGKAMLSFQGC